MMSWTWQLDLVVVTTDYASETTKRSSATAPPETDFATSGPAALTAYLHRVLKTALQKQSLKTQPNGVFFSKFFHLKTSAKICHIAVIKLSATSLA